MRLIAVWMVLGLVGCGDDAPEIPDLGPHPEHHGPAVVPLTEGINPRLLRRFRPLEPVMSRAGGAPSTAEIALGRMLYFDPRLSRDRTVSCNSCHPLAEYGVDHNVTSFGVRGRRGARNAPTVFNAAAHFAQFWDGRARDVEAQAGAPLLNPTEMAMPSRDAVVRVIASIPGYVSSFGAAFPDADNPLTFDNVALAIGAFERTLVTPSRWDRFLRGDASVLTHDELEGLRVFADLGCVQCHTGELVGGSMFQRVGAIIPWPDQRDQGRFEVTHLDADRMAFKVPSLRNVAKTAPYFHDGSAPTLSDAVRTMAHHQLGEEISDAELASILAWLDTLTGELPGETIARPALPPDGKQQP